MDPAHRIIDANANRAREALRVMEDVARFGLDHRELCGEIKSLRHDLRAALEAAGIDRGLRLAARDAEQDVGAAVSVESERARAGVRDVALAAASRLAEALRSIEEAAKSLGLEPRGIEALRYRAYTAERRLGLALGTGRARQWRLCVLITQAMCGGRDWEQVALAALRGGADCLQLREKGLPDRELLRRARRVVAMARKHGAAAIVNDRPDVALLAGADGVHVGQDDLGVEEVRRVAGFRLLVGVSTADLEQARAAVRAGADYCGVGPMFASATKEKPRLAGPEYLRAYLAEPALAARPHLAIGGIGPENVGVLVAAGARGVAVCGAVCGAADPESACGALVAALAGGRGEPEGRGADAAGREEPTRDRPRSRHEGGIR